jgi:hypothetical protein
MRTILKRRPRSFKSKRRKDKSKLKDNSASKLSSEESRTSRSKQDWLKNSVFVKNK